MKKLYLLIFPLTLGINLSAQNPDGWIEAGAEWHHKFWVIQTGYMRHYLDGVEEINDSTFQVVKSEQQWGIHQPDGSIAVQDLFPGPSEYQFYTAGDSVFIRTDHGLQFVWHKNPQVGDIWDFGPQATQTNPIPLNAYAIVQAIEPVEINGFMTFDIIAAPCKDPQGTLFEEDEINDTNPYAMFVSRINNVIGPRHDFAHIGLFSTTQTIAVTAYSYDRILCYSSDNMGFHLFDNAPDCNNGLLSLDDSPNNQFDVNIYPNPAYTSFSITNPEQIKSIQIFDTQGRLHLQSESLPVDIRLLTPGIYWVQIEQMGRQVKVEKLVVR